MSVDRRTIVAVVCGTVAIIGLLGVIYVRDAPALGVLLFIEALVLGFVFGVRDGTLAATVPVLAVFVVELVRRGSDAIELAGPVLFVTVLMAFCAFMTGAVRDRFGGSAVHRAETSNSAGRE